MKNKRYKVLDFYEVEIVTQGNYDISDVECVGNADTIDEIEYYIQQRIDDTDGECYIMIYDRQSYSFVNFDDIQEA